MALCVSGGLALSRASSLSAFPSSFGSHCQAHLADSMAYPSPSPLRIDCPVGVGTGLQTPPPTQRHWRDWPSQGVLEKVQGCAHTLLPYLLQSFYLLQLCLEQAGRVSLPL